MQGDFTICRTCGRFGMRLGIGLSEVCRQRPETRRMELQWNTFFRDGKHPNTGVPCGHDVKIMRSELHRTRTAVEKRSRGRRLSTKTKPWVAAASGVVQERLGMEEEFPGVFEEEEYQEMASSGTWRSREVRR